MKRLNPYFATLITPPTIILNVYSALVERINIIVILAVSVTTLMFWVVSIKNKKLESMRNAAECEAAQAEAEYHRERLKLLREKQSENLPDIDEFAM